MSVFDPRFPVDLSLGATGGSGWTTSVTSTADGSEYRLGRWKQTLGRWVVGKTIRQRAQWEALIAFHRVMQGMASTFRFKDWTDFQVTEGRLTTLNGQAVLAKIYSLQDVFGNVITALRPITRPVFGSITFLAGTPSAVDYDTGIVTGGDADTTSWVGEFDVPSRFSEDTPDIAMVQADAAGWKGITVVEVRSEP